MINVKREIDRYMTVDFDNENINVLYDKDEQVLAEVVKTFGQTLKKVDKERNKYSYQLEEILETLENFEKNQNKSNILKQEWEKTKEEINLLLNTIIGIMDCVEDIYRYSVKAGDESLKTQMEMQWLKSGNIINQYGITRVEGIGTPFTSSLHIAKSVEEKTEIPNGQIIDVIRSGYIWKGNIIRKAEVVVNRIYE